MSGFDRRYFLKGLTAAGTAGLAVSKPLGALPSETSISPATMKGRGTIQPLKSGVAQKFWINSPQAELPSRPWRKIHLDFL